MPPALNHVSSRKVAPKNTADFPDDDFPPEWRVISRRGQVLGWVWIRRPNISSMFEQVWHAVDPDGEHISTHGTGHSAYRDAMAAVIERFDTPHDMK